MVKSVSVVMGCGSSRLVTPKPRSWSRAVVQQAQADARHAVLGHLRRDQRGDLVDARVGGGRRLGLARPPARRRSRRPRWRRGGTHDDACADSLRCPRRRGRRGAHARARGRMTCARNVSIGWRWRARCSCRTGGGHGRRHAGGGADRATRAIRAARAAVESGHCRARRGRHRAALDARRAHRDLDQHAGFRARRERRRMAQQFARRPDTVYVRTPDGGRRVRRLGRGLGTRRVDRPLDRARRRRAGERHLPGAVAPGDGTWLIQAEVFVPTACRGSAYCAAHP